MFQHHVDCFCVVRGLEVDDCHICFLINCEWLSTRVQMEGKAYWINDHLLLKLCRASSEDYSMGVNLMPSELDHHI